MTRWPQGEVEIEQHLTAGHLQKVTGSHVDGTRLLAKARRTIATAADIVTIDPDSAFVLAYDAARYAGTALLAQQGLRPPAPVATTRSNAHSVPSSATASAGSEPCADAAMNWSTPASPTKRPTMAAPRLPSDLWVRPSDGSRPVPGGPPPSVRRPGLTRARAAGHHWSVPDSAPTAHSKRPSS